MATADLVHRRAPRNSILPRMGAASGFSRFCQYHSRKIDDKSAMFGVFRHERHGLVDDIMRRRMCLLPARH